MRLGKRGPEIPSLARSLTISNVKYLYHVVTYRETTLSPEIHYMNLAFGPCCVLSVS